MQAGIGVALALVPPSGLGSELSRLAPCWRTPTTITRIITHMPPTVTTPPPRHTIRRRRIIRPREAVGTPITETTTLAEYAGRPPAANRPRAAGQSAPRAAET